MNNTATLIKHAKQVTTKLELAKNVVKITTCFDGIKLSDTEITVLSYYMVYGINHQSKGLIVKAGVCKNLANIKTVMVKLKKLGLIYKDELNGKVYVSKSLAFDITPTIGIYLKLHN